MTSPVLTHGKTRWTCISQHSSHIFSHNSNPVDGPSPALTNDNRQGC
jgi:hypothetical protein